MVKTRTHRIQQERHSACAEWRSEQQVQGSDAPRPEPKAMCDFFRFRNLLDLNDPPFEFYFVFFSKPFRPLEVQTKTNF